MADPKAYAVLNVHVDGTLLAEAGQVQIQRSSNSAANTTILNGYAGETPGAPTSTVTVTNAVPAADFELDAGQHILTGKIVEIGIVGPGGKQAVFKGVIIEDTTEYAVNGAASYSFTARGAMPLFE